MNICDKSFFDNLGDGGDQTTDPIFILGLPRAGSTLIEQILASHSMIDGTLELPNILSIAQSLRGGDIYGKEGNYPKSMTSLTLDQRDSLGSMFINDTMMHRQDAPMFTDKMPNNFRHIGLIHLILPNAKIIDARRYPLDCCFSMFKQLFAQVSNPPIDPIREAVIMSLYTNLGGQKNIITETAQHSPQIHLDTPVSVSYTHLTLPTKA